MYKNPVMTIEWYDAAFTDDEAVVDETFPPTQLTCGFVIEENDEHVHIATNVYYNMEKKVVQPIDGFLIPKSAIVSVRKIGFYEGDE